MSWEKALRCLIMAALLVVMTPFQSKAKTFEERSVPSQSFDPLWRLPVVFGGGDAWNQKIHPGILHLSGYRWIDGSNGYARGEKDAAGDG